MSIPPEQSTDQRTPVVCAMLRTKTAFGGYELDDQPADWQSGKSTTAVFWCLKTMTTAGPDDQFAHPSTCQAGRACFRSPED